MPLGTTNIGLTDIRDEFGKTLNTGGLSLTNYINAAIETSTRLGTDTTTKEVEGFQSYDHGGCKFKFDPHQPTVTSKIAVDLYDDTLNHLPAQSDSNVYTDNYNDTSTFITGTPGYLRVSGTTTDRMIRWTSVNSGESYKAHTNGASTTAFWVYFDSLPSSGYFFLQDSADDGANTFNYYGISLRVQSTGELRVVIGNGGGRNSFNRKTFIGSTGNFSTGTWYFVCVFMATSGTNTISGCTATITPSTATSLSTANVLTGGTSGTATTIAYENNLHLTLGGDAFSGDGFNARFGHIYRFDNVIGNNGSGSILEDIFTTTRTDY